MDLEINNNPKKQNNFDFKEKIKNLNNNVSLQRNIKLDAQWPSLVGSIPGLTPEMESDFRAGTRVLSGMFATGKIVRPNQYGGTAITCAPLGWLEVYEAWNSREGIALVTKEKSVEDMNKLSMWLSDRGINLKASPELVPNGAVSLISNTLQLVPEEFYLKKGKENRQALESVIIGSKPLVGAGKASFIETRRELNIYEGSINWPVRPLVGTFLHELGHSAATIIKSNSEDWDKIVKAHDELSKSKSFMGTKFLPNRDANDRIEYQAANVDEFFAETFMMYVSQGPRLRNFIQNQQSFSVQNNWNTVYNLIREKITNNREYDNIEFK